jgi:hypothetical protein
MSADITLGTDSIYIISLSKTVEFPAAKLKLLRVTTLTLEVQTAVTVTPKRRVKTDE